MTTHMDLRARGKLPPCAECRMCDGTMLKWFGHFPADILFLVDYPRHEDVQRGAFQSGAGQTFFKLLNILREKMGPSSPVAHLRMCAGYALQCGFSDPDAKIKAYPTDAALCSFRDKYIAQVNPRLIVPMGKLASQSIGLKVDNFNKTRGRLTHATIGGVTYKVLPTFHPAAVYLSSGLTKLFCNELRNALEIASFGTKEHATNLTKEIANYQYPSSNTEIKRLTEHILAVTPLADPLCVDTETNTLRIHLDEASGLFARENEYAKCIAFSVAWGRRLSAAWLLNHKELTRKDSDAWWYRLPYVFNLLMSEHPKIAHNLQFDRRVFRHLARMLQWKCESDPVYASIFASECHYTVAAIVEAGGICNAIWDSMLLEHAIEEDKKGFYGLKPCTKKYEPEFAGYEEALRNSDAGEEIRLNSLKDFVAYLDTSEEFVALRKEIATLGPWLEHTKDDAPCPIPERFVAMLRSRPDTIKVADVWKTLSKSSAKNKYATKVRAWVQDTYGGEDKELRKQVWDTYKGKQNYRESLYADPKTPVFLQDFEWYLWFSKNHSKDFVAPAVKAKAAVLKTAFEKEREEINFEDFEVADLLIYAAIDTDMSYCAHGKQLLALAAEEAAHPSIKYKGGPTATSLYANQFVSMPVCSALSRMVDIGVAIDFDYLEELDTKYLAQAEEMKDLVFALGGVTETGLNGVSLNLNSTDHIVNLLVACGYEQYLTEKTPTKKTRVTKLVLQGITKAVETPKEEMDICKAILSYRESLKASKTFLKNFRKMAAWDGRVHPSFHQIGTATYRLSSSGPNFQNIPHYLAGFNLKKCVVPSHPDWCIVNIDASGAEIKVLTAYLAKMDGEHKGQQLIHEMNNDPKFDIHSKFCAYIFGPSLFGYDVSTQAGWDAAYDWVRANKDDNPIVIKARKKTKTTVFGTLYGQTAHGLAYMLGIELHEAEFIISQFFAADPSIGAYVQWSQDFVKFYKYITTILGRRRRFPLAGLDKRQLGRALRQATNFLIQSLTVDIFNYLLAGFIPVLEKRLGGRPLLQVHDALVMEMPKSNLLLAKDLMKEHFEEKAAAVFGFLPARFKCDMEAGDNYGEVEKIDRYVERLRAAEKEAAFIEEEERDGADVRLKLAEGDPDEAHLVEDLAFESEGDEVDMTI